MKTKDARYRIRGIKLLACVLGLGSLVWGLQSGWAESIQGEDLQALEELQALAQSSPSGRLSFLIGSILVKIGRFEDAVPPLEKAVELHPLLADYALSALAESYRHLGRQEEAASALQRLLQEHPESLFREKALREVGLDYAKLGNDRKAEAAYLIHLDQFPGSPHRPAVLLAFSQVLLKAGRLKEAEQLLRQLYLKEPGTKEAQKALDLLASIPQVKPLDEDERWKRAVLLSQLGLHSRAVAELSPFVEEVSPYASKTRLLMGISLFHLKDYGKAGEALLPLTEAGPLQPEALYWLGKSLGRLGKSEKALSVFQALYTPFPKSPKASDALYLSALIYEEEGKPDQALRLYDKLFKAYPRSDRYEEALWRRGWIRFKEKVYRKALPDFKALAERRGSPFADQALYWQGKAKEQMKRPKEAARIYLSLLRSPRSDYYALRAREALVRLTGKDHHPSPIDRPLQDHHPSPIDRRAKETPRLAKARELDALRFKEEAVEEYWELAITSPSDLGLLGEALSRFVRAERFDKVLWITKKFLKPLYLQRSKAEPIPDFLRYLFPLGYFPLVREEASALDLDPYLVLAVIREESAFQKDAVSRAGARGLMQLLPQTAEPLAKEVKLDHLAINGLDSPPLNVALGARHLSQLLQEFSGDLPLALAAYNAGPHQVRRWLEKHGYHSPETFIEEIPFQETRGYVKRVLGSYDRYLALYGEGKREERVVR